MMILRLIIVKGMLLDNNQPAPAPPRSNVEPLLPEHAS